MKKYIIICIKIYSEFWTIFTIIFWLLVDVSPLSAFNKKQLNLFAVIDFRIISMMIVVIELFEMSKLQ